jgi:GLPGLI family protein
MRFFTVAVILMLALLSCNTFHTSKEQQGVIEYDVTYMQNYSSVPTNLLPKKVTLKFKSNKSITTIDGFMGMFSVSNITDLRKHTNTVLLRVMDNKYYTEGEKDELPVFFDGLDNMKVVFANDTKKIAGLTCKKAFVAFPKTNRQGYEVYYTDHILIKEPNRANPYHEIDGILMEFNMSLYNVSMRLNAKKYLPVEVDDDLFEVPDDYKKISKEKMASIIIKLLE